ncbi:hypothetical protein Zmor_021588 [Zophobas morio]|uniref:PDZ domain-containing protein n=1 Tax=Zophobas morio TaxID=2755281 RepID=A0AA38I6E0_9CUCU|nr:hypothetical protein Zmor_021588 [Zophobas morio]
METIAEDQETEYELDKVKKKYANLGHTILMVQLERSNQGLGLSLAGHKDRNCMAVFVCGLNPNGAAFKTGGIQIGDEILEVSSRPTASHSGTKRRFCRFSKHFDMIIIV